MNIELIDKWTKKLSDIEDAIYKDLAKAINKNSALLVAIQTQYQLFDRGEDSMAMTLLPSYAVSTIARKKKKKQPFDRVTLKDTGAFYESITIDASNNVMTIKASVNYTSFLLNRYGRDVFGIQRVKFNEFLEKYFVPIFKDSVNKITAR